MKCADCGKDFPLTRIRFKHIGLLEGTPPGTNIQEHKAQCDPCARIVPIDETTMKTPPTKGEKK